MSTVDYSLYLSYVGLPASVGLSVGVGNVATEGYALSANFTLISHLPHLLVPIVFIRFRNVFISMP